MEYYKIKIVNNDFSFLNINSNSKGSRRKRVVVDNNGKKAFFKYQGDNYLVSESCSEKMCYEIARVLGYDCAKIELAQDENGEVGILNYLFVDMNSFAHEDAVSYLNIYNLKRQEYYTLSNIKNTLDRLDKKLFFQFIRIMIFDALVGETDRHEENWGIEKNDNNYTLSPLYDNGCNLLNKFKDTSYAEKFYSGVKNFDSYILNSKTLIYKDDEKSKYKHFELIELLNSTYHDYVQSEIKNLSKLTDEVIENIVLKIPERLLTKEHKNFIIMYLKKRRDILLNIK